MGVFCTSGARNENAINHWDGVGVWIFGRGDWTETTINMITRTVLRHEINESSFFFFLDSLLSSWPFGLFLLPSSFPFLAMRWYRKDPSEASD